MSRAHNISKKWDASSKWKSRPPGGGYVFSGGHNLQADVPPANIAVLFDTAYEAGRYPLANYK
jgi:uroporphyrinogen decarboxylase